MDWKKLGKKLLFPPLWLTVLLTVASAVLLTFVFVKHWEQQIIAYIIYVLAFYTLSVVTLFCVMVLPKQYGALKKKIYGHPFGNRYMTDRVFRTRISLCVSLGINLLYVIINLWFWNFNRSWWFVVLAIYYVIMAVMRFLLVRYVRIRKIGASILVGIVGMVLVALAYPLYNRVLKKQREKIAPEILSLSDELLK